MRLVTMNINGLPSAWEAGLKRYVRDSGADVFCMQETKAKVWPPEYRIPEYEEYWCPCSRAGYAGVGAFTKVLPEVVYSGLGTADSEREGRTMTLEFEGMYLVNVYAPASGEQLEKLSEKMRWLEQLKQAVAYLERNKPVVLCGDLNVAATRLDLPADVAGERTAGNTDEERRLLQDVLAVGLVDVMPLCGRRRLVTWSPQWARYRDDARLGWRLDYFLVSEKLIDSVTACRVLEPTPLSDHRAVVLDLK